ncbi:site-specific integrase [Asticcacaulis sp. EMRT-3]|uniref:tyrosine-type recombinase/integrase n=1 Tax=Asticcacaulis sp. EMRT-3 TaxID=3040349 RepID=UPI0024AFF7A4|nr:site-specific integrase [Asticcacaulis sp. EMRT-3]MDI7774679.1 site-specific integrase [Asticcacaulis sp. EMRT-3]
MSGSFNRGDDMALFSLDGQRKYLCRSEGKRFLRAASGMDDGTRLFCHLLHFTGCRISEALEIAPRRLDVEGKRVVFRTLKRRKRVFRAVPVPAPLMTGLVHLSRNHGLDERLWSWCRQTAWRRVKKVMAAASIDGPQAAPRGLRHQFGVQALQANLPLTVTQRLLGHASPGTTAIYQYATGDDERRLMHRMWRGWGES